MIFSIVIPSFNQGNYIHKTLENVFELKRRALERGIQIEILLFDSESEIGVQKIISGCKSQIDFVSIKKDKGQYDAINGGMKKISGEYWTWLNTDDKIDIGGFLKLADILKNNQNIDYIYGNIQMIDQNDNQLEIIQAEALTIDRLVNVNAGIFQPGSFFKREFTEKIGLLKNYDCCFDYEYILRLLKANAKFYKCNFVIADFRYYSSSKSGSLVNQFIEEQLSISKLYGRKIFSLLTLELYLRKVKRRFFN